MPEPPLDSHRLIETLTRNNVRFVLVGGLAMVAHGTDTVTQDLDLGYARDPENLAALATALEGLNPRPRGFPEDLPFTWDIRTLRSGANFTLVTDAGPADLLADLAGVVSFQELWERSEVIELYGCPVRVASVDDLIAMKRAAGREKDMGHIRELECLRALLHDRGPQ